VIDSAASRATAVRLTEDTLVVDLADGRTVSVPLAWHPRLLQGSPAERANHRFIGGCETKFFKLKIKACIFWEVCL